MITAHREIALAILSGPGPVSRRAGSFLGQLAVDYRPLTDRQAQWLAQLMERAGLDTLADGGEHDD